MHEYPVLEYLRLGVMSPDQATSLRYAHPLTRETKRNTLGALSAWTAILLKWMATMSNALELNRCGQLEEEVGTALSQNNAREACSSVKEYEIDTLARTLKKIEGKGVLTKIEMQGPCVSMKLIDTSQTFGVKGFSSSYL